MDGETPRSVPTGVVEELQAMVDELGLLSLDPRLQSGQQIRIVTGPFSGFVGKLASLDSHERVKVLLDILGTQTMVTVAASRVGLVSAA